MHSRVSRGTIRICTHANQFTKASCTSMVYDDATEGCEGAWPGEGEKGVVGFAHPVDTGAIGDRID
jgi:hypothetical protein